MIILPIEYPAACVIFSIDPEAPHNTDSLLACEEGPGIFAKAMALGSLLLVIFSLPVSLFFVVKVVQVGGNSLVSEINPNTENSGSFGSLLVRSTFLL